MPAGELCNRTGRGRQRSATQHATIATDKELMARPMLSVNAEPWTPAPLPSDVFAPALIEEPRAPGPMDILPNNLADWPARKSWLSSDSASVGGMLGRVVARLVLLI